MTPREPLWRRYLRFLGPNVDADIEDELTHHLAALEADLRAQGMTERAAREAARSRFGDVGAIRKTLRRQDSRRLGRAARADWWVGWV